MSAKLGYLASKTMTRYINVSVNGIIPSLFMGAGFAHALEKKKYHYLPCFLFLPVLSTGFLLYEGRDDLVRYIHRKIENKY
jgi:hypothetical protein